MIRKLMNVWKHKAVSIANSLQAIHFQIRKSFNSEYISKMSWSVTYKSFIWSEKLNSVNYSPAPPLYLAIE